MQTEQPPTTAATPATPARIEPSGRRVTLRRIVISFLLAVAAVGFVYAFTSSEDEVVPTLREEGIVRVFPEDGDLNLRQDEIGVEFSNGFTGAMQLDTVEIPDDQLKRVGLNTITYTPVPGSETGALSPGRHCATALFWLVTETREQARPPYTWCFNVH